LVAADAHPDVCLLEAPIKVDAVRELQHRLSLAPMEGGQHVAILPDIDRASPGAANSLLKTLEEPPTGALLLLTASDLAGVLPTVGSRCQSLALRPMPVEQAAAALVERLGVDAEKADALARLSGGRLGWALRAALEPGVLQARDEWLGRLESAITARRSARLVLAEGLGRDREALPDGLQLWLGWLRDVLLLQHGLDAAIVNVDRQVPLRRAAERWSVRATVAALRALETASARLRGGASVELAADVFLLELPA
jgi:DNA polymerase-3 subunit delta'